MKRIFIDEAANMTDSLDKEYYASQVHEEWQRLIKDAYQRQHRT
jgi:hypothetical protein